MAGILAISLFLHPSMEDKAYYKIGDVVIRKKVQMTLKEFIGFRLAEHHNQTGKKRVTLKENQPSDRNTEITNTEIWMAVTENGTLLKVKMEVSKRHIDLYAKDESVYNGTDRISVINDHKPEPITRSYEECESGEWNYTAYKKWEIVENQKRKQLNQTLFLLEKHIQSNVVRPIAKGTSRAKEHQVRCVAIYIAMLKQQRAYPTIIGHNRINRFLKTYPGTKELYNQIFDEFIAKFEYKETASTKASRKRVVEN